MEFKDFTGRFQTVVSITFLSEFNIIVVFKNSGRLDSVTLSRTEFLNRVSTVLTLEEK